MSAFRSSDEVARLRRALFDAATEEHRLHQRATAERQAERRWQERAALAEARAEPLLAAEARARAAVHRDRAGYLEAEYFDQQSYVEQLRQAVRNPGRAVSPVLPVLPGANPQDVERRLAELEEEARLEEELARLKRRLQAPDDETPESASTV